jgi:hypothetical protein
MKLKFFPEMTYRTRYWPGRSVAERADGITLDFFGNINQQIDIMHVAVSMFNPVEYFFHPSGSFTTWTALATRFVMIKPGERP